MPYDSVKVREIIRAAPAHRSMPNGELVSDLAEQLGFAEQTLAEMAVKVRKAHDETSLVQARVDALVESERKLREQSVGRTEMVAALKAIAKSPKGAAKLAAQALLAANIVPETPVPTS